MQSEFNKKNGNGKRERVEEQLIDPVCEMRVTPDTPYKRQWGGRKWYFCSAACSEKFAREPEEYAREVATGHREKHPKAEGAGTRI